MLGLPPHIHIARTRSSTIMLDVAADRYTRLPAREAHVLAIFNSDAADDETAMTIRTLCGRGVLVDGGRRPGPPALAKPCRSAIEAEIERTPSRAGLGDLIAWRWRARTKSFAAVLERLPRPASRRGEVSLDAVIHLAQRFERTRLVAPFGRQCLPDACALTSLCRKQGIPAKLVIGVREAPFAAHAWTVVDDLVLSDPLDVVRELSPILCL
jgi:hypothetical protein